MTAMKKWIVDCPTHVFSFPTRVFTVEGSHFTVDEGVLILYGQPSATGVPTPVFALAPGQWNAIGVPEEDARDKSEGAK